MRRTGTKAIQKFRGAPQGLLLTVEQFNRLIPIGTPVRYYPMAGESEYRDSKTRSVAWTVGDHTSVQIEGMAGSVCVAHLELRDGTP